MTKLPFKIFPQPPGKPSFRIAPFPGAGRAGAFSLIELLVTVAILAVLAAIIMPTTNVLREKANAAKCMSNIRTVGQGLALYAGENGGFPTFGVPIPGNNGPPYWAEKIDPFVGRHSNAYLCPSEKSPGAIPDPEEKKAPYTYPGSWYAGIHYGANPAVVTELVNNDGDYAPATPGMIARPSRTVMLAESWDTRSNTMGVLLVVGHLGESSRMNPRPYTVSFIKYRHSGKANVCFADGHVETLTEKQLMPNKALPKTDPDYSLWDLL